jgi:hypothetical protein
MTKRRQGYAARLGEVKNAHKSESVKTGDLDADVRIILK